MTRRKFMREFKIEAVRLPASPPATAPCVRLGMPAAPPASSAGMCSHDSAKVAFSAAQHCARVAKTTAELLSAIGAGSFAVSVDRKGLNSSVMRCEGLVFCVRIFRRKG